MSKTLIGKIFGRYEVIGEGNRKGTNRYWRCKCDCGVVKEVRGSHLISGNTVSCGCKKKFFENLIGNRFGRLVVIAYARKDKHHMWSCLCDCNNKVIVDGTSLKSKNTQSCGCFQKAMTKEACVTHGLRTGEYKYVYNPDYYQYKRKNPIFVLKKNVSCMIYHALKRTGNSKCGQSVLNYLPYTLNELKQHLEKQFESWMNWENYGEWHIDHIIPQSKFNYNKMSDLDFVRCWELSNLRPLSKEDNMKKGDKY
jgi:hypothetical protein